MPQLGKPILRFRPNLLLQSMVHFYTDHWDYWSSALGVQARIIAIYPFFTVYSQIKNGLQQASGGNQSLPLTTL